ncbi:MAG: hypothetical protein WD018_06530 [Nitrosopumilaceae archaeon]
MNQTTIRIEKATVERISKFGKFHDTYDAILNSLCEHTENCKSIKNGDK